MDEDLLEACTDELETFVEEARIGGPDMAHKFMSELEESVETLGGIAETHDAATLVDLMYLSQAIARNTYIETCPGRGVLEILKAMPSCEDWMRFVDVTEELSFNLSLLDGPSGAASGDASSADQDGEEASTTWTNYYLCPCGEEWEDTHDSCCNDRCPSCNREIEPYISDDGSVPDQKISDAYDEALKRNAAPTQG